MAFRTFQGHTHSEDGWPYVDQGSCQWVTVPGTAVTLQIQVGQPLAIMRGFAADFNAFVEPMRDADSACWTEGNSVSTSNHPGGTAMDIDWGSHRFQVSYDGFNQGQIATCRELLDFYEGTIFWGQDWGEQGIGPFDCMHWQMGPDTFENAHTADFIVRKIRADGFSTFRRGNVVLPPSDAADVLMRATGITHEKAWDIMVGVINGLRDSECNNVNRIAMWLAQIGHESAGFNATEEYQSGDESTDRWKYKGRTWIQITWRSNYAGLSQWAFDKGLIPSPTYFVDDPKKLAEIQYAGLGPAWYWTVARPQINSLCDRGDLVAVTQAINGGQNGAPDRKRRYDLALALGDQLLTLTSSAPSTPGDDMAAVPQEQWDRVYRELTQPLPSRSPLRHLGEGAIDTMAGFVLNTDGSEHVEICRLLAGYGHPPTLALLREVAGADPAKYPDRQEDRLMAQAILADVATPVAAPSVAAVAAPTAAPQVVYVPAPEPVGALPNPGAISTGGIIGQAYDALEALQLSGVLSDTEKAPLMALITVLQTKTGASA